MNQKNLAYIALISTSLIWGITLPLMKVNLEVIPPLTLAFLRFSIAAILAISISELHGLKLKDFIHIAFFSFFGITLHIGLFLFGLRNTEAIDATIIMAMSPVITSILASLTLNEKINLIHTVGIVLALLGSISYLVLPHLFSPEGFTLNPTGDLLIIAAILSGSIYTIGSKRLFKTYDPSSISAVSFVVGAISFLPGMFFEYFQNPSWTSQITTFNLFSIAFIGVLSSFIAYSTLEWGLSKVDVHVDSTISYLTLIISVLIATVFLGETLNIPMFISSLILIVSGIYLVTKFKPKSHHFHHRIHKV